MDSAWIESTSKSVNEAKDAMERADYGSAASAYAKVTQRLHSLLVDFYCEQSSAYLKAENFHEARNVAQKASSLDSTKGFAWYCEGMALYGMKKKQEAITMFKKAGENEKVKSRIMMYKEWEMKCKTELEDEMDDMQVIDATIDANEHSIAGSSARTVPYERKEKRKPPIDNTKMQWYQSSTHVNVDIYAKNVDMGKSEIVFSEKHVSVRLSRPDKEDYLLNKELAEEIMTDECKYSASKFKVEIRMKKKNMGSTWQTLDVDASLRSAAAQAAADNNQWNRKMEERKKEWNDLVDKELKNYQEDDSPMGMFKTLFKNSDDDVRKAMAKSFSESGGQVLSTDWNEVKKKKVVYEPKK